MNGANYVRLMARYNRWMNHKLYDACARLDDETRRADRGAFFGSIHATLNHILWADLLALSRFLGEPGPAHDVRTTIASDFEELRRIRERTDTALIEACETLTVESLESPFVHRSVTEGYERELPLWAMMTHLFNHQIHHRGQLTTLLCQLGIDVGQTDLHGMPESTELAFARMSER